MGWVDFGFRPGPGRSQREPPSGVWAARRTPGRSGMVAEWVEVWPASGAVPGKFSIPSWRSMNETRFRRSSMAALSCPWAAGPLHHVSQATDLLFQCLQTRCKPQLRRIGRFHSLGGLHVRKPGPLGSRQTTGTEKHDCGADSESEGYPQTERSR